MINITRLPETPIAKRCTPMQPGEITEFKCGCTYTLNHKGKATWLYICPDMRDRLYKLNQYTK